MENYKMATEKLRVQFRPVPYIQDINQTQDRDPAFMYKNLIITYRSDPTRVQRYLKAGWEIVETTKANKDDRSFTANSKEDKLRPQMLVETTSDGHEQILMKILKSTWEQNQVDKKGQRDALRLQDAKRRGDKVTRRGGEVITRGSELSDKYTENSGLPEEL